MHRHPIRHFTLYFASVNLFNMQFKFVWLPLVILSGVSSIHGSPSALGGVQDRTVAIVGDLTSRGDVQCNWCGLCSYPSPVASGIIFILISDCFTALAAEGVACAAAILEGGCSEYRLLLSQFYFNQHAFQISWQTFPAFSMPSL